MSWTITTADILEWAASYTGEKFHALISDPPYNLESIKKRFGTRDAAPAKYGNDGSFSRLSKGFMNQTWDTDVAFHSETWEAISAHLLPGAFGMVFSSTRTYHRLAVALEDAGLILHPSIFLWAFGSGFPKATNISKQIDKGLGLSGIVDGKLPYPGSTNKRISMGDGWQEEPDNILPESELAKVWYGHRYGLQALKPAVEPIIVFQKPYQGRPIENIKETGAGTLNIDGTRIPSEPYPINTWDDNAHPFGNGTGNEYTTRESTGRWPSNFILDSETAKLLDQQGDYSRFFYTVENQLDEAEQVFYCGKASSKEKNFGLDDLKDVVVSDGRVKEIDNAYQRGQTIRKNFHPTVKPIKLIQYLSTLLLPPDKYNPRRILIPFSGSGSEMIGALQAGWEEVLGVELKDEYAQLATGRLNAWLK